MLCIYCCDEVKGCPTSNLWFQFLTRDSYHVGARVTCRWVGPLSLQAHTKSRSKSEWPFFLSFSSVLVIMHPINCSSGSDGRRTIAIHSWRILLLLDHPWFLLPSYKVLCDAIFVTEYRGEWPQEVVVLVHMHTPTYTHTTQYLINYELIFDCISIYKYKYEWVTPNIFILSKFLFNRPSDSSLVVYK